MSTIWKVILFRASKPFVDRIFVYSQTQKTMLQ